MGLKGWLADTIGWFALKQAPYHLAQWLSLSANLFLL